MRLLQVNALDAQGGAAVAARRLYTALSRQPGVTSLMGVMEKKSDASNIYVLTRNRSRIKQKLLDKCSNALLKWAHPNGSTFFSAYLFPGHVARAIYDLRPDIIHLHWISNNFISPLTLERVAALNRPVVWTLHDTWPLTGGCHYFGSCRQWLEKCAHCPVLQRHFPYNLARLLWESKSGAYARLKPVIVALNSHFCNISKQSALLRPYRVEMLPNPIDAAVFRPVPTRLARQLLGLVPETRYILFGACSATIDHNKGYDLLAAALNALPAASREKTCCLIFGASHGESSPPLPLPTRFLGVLHDEISLALAYSAADVFVCPSREENLPNTIMEALACGTPVAAFAVGGIPDMIDHRVNGMLAAPHDPHELAEGIAYILARDDRRRHMGKAAREKVLQQYDMPVVARKYVSLYEDLLNSQGGQC